jgi:hypothetical protein
MSDNRLFLDALSEMVMLSSYGNTKNLIVTAIETQGRLDYEAMELAFQKAAEKFPQIRSTIREVREERMLRLQRQFRPDLSLQMYASDLTAGGSSAPVLDRYLEHAAPRLDRDWDLFEELPAELHVAKIGKDHHVVAPVIHHVAADGGVASEFGREFLANYHRNVTGEEPEWAAGTPGISTSAKRQVKRIHVPWTKFFSDGRKAIANLLERPILPQGSGLRSDLRQFHVKRVLSLDDSASLGQVASQYRASLVDMLSAAANLAVDRWNQARNLAPGMVTTAISVNMRGRFQGMDRPNNSAQLFLKSFPEERTDPSAFVRAIGLHRIKQLRKQLDFTFFSDVSRMNGAVRLLPFPWRRKVVHFLTNQHQYSVGVTLLGVIWPVFKNGRPTGETSFTRTGDLEITEVHGVGYKLLSSTRLVFIAYGFRSRFNIVMATSACLFTKDEAEAFMDLTIDNLLTYAGKVRDR